MSSSKRAAISELTHDNWNDEKEGEDAGSFKKATEDELQKRVLKVADRRNIGGDSESGTAPQQPSALQSSTQPHPIDKLPAGKLPLSASQADLEASHPEEQYSQQNYSCYTPTMNSMSSYKTSNDGQAAFSQTTQSVNYHQTPEAPASSSCAPATAQQPRVDSSNQPNSIPTYSAAVNAYSMKGRSEMHMTASSQQQMKSSIEVKQTIPITEEPPVAQLAAVDLTMTNATIDHIPTLMSVSATKSVEESPQKVVVPQSPVNAAPVKLDDGLAPLDFSLPSATGSSEPEIIDYSAR